MRNRNLRSILLMLAVVLIAACSSDDPAAPGDDDDNDNGGGGIPTKGDTLRVQTLDTIAGQFELWSGLPPDTIAARAVGYLQGLSAIEDAGITDGTTSVWAVFKDGFLLLIPNNRAPSSMADTLVDASSVPPPAMGVAPRRLKIPAGREAMRALRVPETAREIPVSKQFRAVNAIGTCHVNPLPVIKSLLREGNYVDANPPLPTVNGLKNINGDGVFYINSHGGPGYDRNQVPYYAVWTLDPIDVATLGNYKAMVDAHELVGMLEYSNRPGGCACVMHYGFTSKFVRKYMRFEKNSLVIVDACHSATAPALALRQAFAFAGASVYVGWTSAVDAPFAYAAMKYLFDRLLGVNRISPESPKQRAFNIDDVREDMATNRNLVTDPSGNATLTVFKLKDDFGLLSPSIQFLSVMEDSEQPVLIIAGMFGTDPGESDRAVRINGESLDVLTWEPTLIECGLPASGANAAGTVVVEIGSGGSPRASNPVNLTKWTGELTYERDEVFDFRVDMTLRVSFRADIHSFRDKPHETPWETTVLFGSMRDASIEVTSSGTYTRPMPPCGDTWTLSRGTSLPSPYETTPEGGWNYFGSVDTQKHELQLNLYALVLYHAGTWEHTGPPECAPFSTPWHIGVQPENCVFDEAGQIGLPAFLMQMGDNFEVTADSREPCAVDSYLQVFIPGSTANASMRWTTMSPVSPPDPDAAR